MYLYFIGGYPHNLTVIFVPVSNLLFFFQSLILNIFIYTVQYSFYNEYLRVPYLDCMIKFYVFNLSIKTLLFQNFFANVCSNTRTF